MRLIFVVVLLSACTGEWRHYGACYLDGVAQYEWDEINHGSSIANGPYPWQPENRGGGWYYHESVGVFEADGCNPKYDLL